METQLERFDTLSLESLQASHMNTILDALGGVKVVGVRHLCVAVYIYMCVVNGQSVGLASGEMFEKYFG